MAEIRFDIVSNANEAASNYEQAISAIIAQSERLVAAQANAAGAFSPPTGSPGAAASQVQAIEAGIAAKERERASIQSTAQVRSQEVTAIQQQIAAATGLAAATDRSAQSSARVFQSEERRLQQSIRLLSLLGGQFRALSQTIRNERLYEEAMGRSASTAKDLARATAALSDARKQGLLTVTTQQALDKDLRLNMKGLNENLRGLTNAFAVLAFGPLSGVGSRIIATGTAVSDLSTAISGSSSGLGRAGLIGAFAGLAAAIVSIGVGVVAFRRLKEAALDFERVQNTLRFATGSQAAGASAFGFVEEEANRLGFALDVAAQQFAKVSAASRGTALEGQATREIFLGISEASVALGLTADQTSGALNAIQQIISKGTVQAEELRGQLGERLPGAFQIAARSIGVTTKELDRMLEQGEVISEDFLPKFAAELRRTFGPEAVRNANSLTAEFNRLENSIDALFREAAQGGFAEGLKAGLRDLSEALQDPGVVQTLTSIGNAIGYVASLAARATKALDDFTDALSDDKLKFLAPQFAPAIESKNRFLGITEDREVRRFLEDIEVLARRANAPGEELLGWLEQIENFDRTGELTAPFTRRDLFEGVGASAKSATENLQDMKREVVDISEQLNKLQQREGLVGLSDRQRFIQEQVNAAENAARRSETRFALADRIALEERAAAAFDAERAQKRLNAERERAFRAGEAQRQRVIQEIRDEEERQKKFREGTEDIEQRNRFLREEIALTREGNVAGLRELEIRRQIAALPDTLVGDARARRVAAIREEAELESVLDSLRDFDDEATKVMDNLRENVQSGIGDTLNDVFLEGEISAKAFGDTVLDIIARITAEAFAADITAALFGGGGGRSNVGGLLSGVGSLFFSRRDQTAALEALRIDQNASLDEVVAELRFQERTQEAQLRETQHQTQTIQDGFGSVYEFLRRSGLSGLVGSPLGGGGGGDQPTDTSGISGILGAIGGSASGLLGGLGVLGVTGSLVSNLIGSTGGVPLALLASRFGTELGFSILGNTLSTLGGNLGSSSVSSAGSFLATGSLGTFGSVLSVLGNVATSVTGIIAAIEADNATDRSAAIVSTVASQALGYLFGPAGSFVGAFAGGAVYAGRDIDRVSRRGIDDVYGGRSPSRVVEETLLTTFDPLFAIVAGIAAETATEVRTKLRTQTTAQATGAAFGEIETPFGFFGITNRRRLGGGGAADRVLEVVQAVDQEIAAYLDAAETALVAAEFQLNEGFTEFDKRRSRAQRGINRIIAERARTTIEALEGESVAEAFLPEKELKRRSTLESLGQTLSDFFTARRDFGLLVREFSGEIIPDFERTILSLEDRFQDARVQFEAMGFDVEKLSAALELGRQVIGQRAFEALQIEELDVLGNDIEAALRSQILTAEQRLAEARAIEAETGLEAIVVAERINALERQRILEEAAEPLRDLLTELTATTSSPLALGTILGNAEGRFSEILSAVQGGDLSQRGDLIDAASNLLDVSRDAFASTPQFFERFDLVVAALEQTIGTIEGLDTSAQAATTTAIQTQTQVLGDILEDIRSEVQTANEYHRENQAARGAVA